MKVIIITTEDPAAMEWLERVLLDKEIEWPIPGGMGDTGTARITSAVAYEAEKF